MNDYSACEHTYTIFDSNGSPVWNWGQSADRFQEQWTAWLLNEVGRALSKSYSLGTLQAARNGKLSTVAEWDGARGEWVCAY